MVPLILRSLDAGNDRRDSRFRVFPHQAPGRELTLFTSAFGRVDERLLFTANLNVCIPGSYVSLDINPHWLGQVRQSMARREFPGSYLFQDEQGAVLYSKHF